MQRIGSPQLEFAFGKFIPRASRLRGQTDGLTFDARENAQARTDDARSHDIDDGGTERRILNEIGTTGTQ